MLAPVAPVQEASNGANGAPARRRTLLIVDDEVGPRQSLKVVFKNEYELLIAENGEQAIALATANKVDAAILDIRMTGMSGIETLQRLKAVDADMEVIMLTAYESIDTVRQALRLGACDYLNKPFDIPVIKTAVGNAMERRSLNSEVKSNSDHLKKLQEELQEQGVEQAMAKSRGEIYASIIHDINGPLTIMSGFLQLIQQRVEGQQQLSGEDLEMVKDRLRRITKQVTNCIDVSRRYLQLIRANPGENRRVSVNQCIADIQDHLRVHQSVKTNTLTFTQLREDVTVQIHGIDFMQAIRNLTVNALQCSPTTHTVEVIAEVLNEPLNAIHDGPHERFVSTNTFRNSVPMLAIHVRDTGPGVPADNMSKLFRESFTTNEVGKGTGLGLSIVKRLITGARGAIGVRTCIGQGTCFTIYLPLD
jgi:two-component system, sensor histidine kinase and response regulator